MKRGDLVTVSLRGEYGKPRPAVVIQSDRLFGITSVIVCPLTSKFDEGLSLRPTVELASGTGLRSRSQIMVEKISVVERGKCGVRIGELDPATLVSLEESLAFVVGLADDAA